MEFFDKQDGKGIFTIINGSIKYVTVKEKEKLERGYIFNNDVLESTTESIAFEKELLTNEVKAKKSLEITNIATLSDQLNLLASTIEVLAEGNTDTRLDAARKVFSDIKIILGK